MFLSGCDRNSTTITEIKTIHGSGVVVEESRAVGGFSEVNFATLGSLRIEQDAREALLIRAEDNLLPYLSTGVQGGVLAMRTANGVDLQQTQPIEFYLTVVDLNDLTFAGVGSAELSNLIVDHLTLSSSGIGSIQCSALDAVGLDVTNSGIGNVITSGQVEGQVVTLSRFGDYDGRDLVSRTATVTITSSGSATVRVSDRLTVILAGSGWVYYIGDPVVEVSGSGAGRVEKIG